MSDDTAITIRDLKLALPPGGDRAYAVDGVSFDLRPGVALSVLIESAAA